MTAGRAEPRAELRAELFRRVDAGDVDLRTALRMMRKVAGKSQAEYAKLVGISPRILMELERGVGNPTLATLEKLLAPFGLEVGIRRKPRAPARPAKAATSRSRAPEEP